VRPASAGAAAARATPRIDLADRVAACPLRTKPVHHVYLEEASLPTSTGACSPLCRTCAAIASCAIARRCWRMGLAPGASSISTPST